MAKFERKQSILVLWRGKKYVVEINSGATLRELGIELQKLTGVKAETMRLIVPQSSHGSSKLLSPFSDEHSSQHLHDIGIIEGKSIRMMGASETEVEEVQRDAKKDLRIAGFDEEEKRQRQLTSRGPQHSLKLPQGPYVFCDFRTLQLPGIELNPPPSEALKRMHMLAADPGIVAIMNKHRWRVGIMTEMAPVGYVGVSPKCILGFNKNHGEEISLRLRTDDLKGFRKYESIKKTLLHELAHMVYSEHDANFYALDKQLNQEAASLDWTRSRSHSLGGFGHSDYLDESVNDGNSSNVFKLGGSGLEHLASARESSVAAACRRLTITSANNSWIPEVGEEPDPDDMGRSMQGGSDPMDTVQENVNIEDAEKAQYASEFANDGFLKNTEPDPDDCQSGPACPSGQASEPHPDDDWVRQQGIMEMHENEPDPDDQELQRIKDPVTFLSSRLQKAIEVLRSEANPVEATTVLQTLFKIIRNVIEHPNDMKYKRLRKGNPAFQKNVAKYKAAMEILFLIGFSEDVIWDEIGNAEPYLILKRNDPGLLWLAKSSLEAQIAY